MRLPRWVHCIYAAVSGYFWLPCPLCHRRFGGHEWRTWEQNSFIWATGEGVCPNCEGKAAELNAGWSPPIHVV